jgi:hypothetical protein
MTDPDDGANDGATRANESLSAAGLRDRGLWNPEDFQVPRYFAVDVGLVLRRCLLCGVLAALGTWLLQLLFSAA